MKKAVIIAVGLGIGPSALAWGGEDAMQVTSDTPAYCLSLAQRMEDEGSMPPQIHVLWEQGRELCQRGHIRGGLMRLRRAMMISRGIAE